MGKADCGRHGCGARADEQLRNSQVRGGSMLGFRTLFGFGVQRKSDPNTWRPVVALLSGLTGVPRAAPQERASGEKLPIPLVASTVPSVREWLQLGKQVGFSAMARYREKLRTYKR
jgi:hypothetical protein